MSLWLKVLPMISRFVSGIILGLLLGIWTYIAFSFRFPIWQVLIAVGSFFAVGGKWEGFWKNLVTMLSGVLWIFLAMWIFTHLGLGRYNLPTAVAVAIFISCAQATLGFLSFIPGALCGAAIYFGTVLRGEPWWHSILAIVAGSILAYIAEFLGSVMVKRS